ncbi:unnamed protein product, partial [Ixodes pacificus]
KLHESEVPLSFSFASRRKCTGSTARESAQIAVHIYNDCRFRASASYLQKLTTAATSLWEQREATGASGRGADLAARDGPIADREENGEKKTGTYHFDSQFSFTATSHGGYHAVFGEGIAPTRGL